MGWDDLPYELHSLIFYHRNLIMASAFLDFILQKAGTFLSSQYLLRTHYAFKFLKDDPFYKSKIPCILKKHDIWVHYYASS